MADSQLKKGYWSFDSRISSTRRKRVTSLSGISSDVLTARMLPEMGMVDGELIVNPSQEQWDHGDLQMTVASTAQKVIMIEAGANEVPEAKILEAIYKAHDINQTLITFINGIVAEVGKPKHDYESCAIPAQMFEDIKKIVPPEEMETAVFTDEKQVREENIKNITARLEEAFADNEDYLAVLGEAVSRRPRAGSDQTAFRRGGYHSQSTRLGDVHARTDADMQRVYAGAAVGNAESRWP